jgi:predicted hotdog family 3-hydroxylacyl-ACP dehydratase
MIDSGFCASNEMKNSHTKTVRNQSGLALVVSIHLPRNAEIAVWKQWHHRHLKKKKSVRVGVVGGVVDVEGVCD